MDLIWLKHLRRKLWIWSHVDLHKSVMENFILYTVLIWQWLFVHILPILSLKSSLESILIPNSFSLFCICSLPIFTSTFSLIDNIALFLINFHTIFTESLKQQSDAFSRWLNGQAYILSRDLSCIIFSITVCISYQKKFILAELRKEVLSTIKRRNQDPHKHLRWKALQQYSYRLKAVNFCCKTHHLECLRQFCVLLCQI